MPRPNWSLLSASIIGHGNRSVAAVVLVRAAPTILLLLYLLGTPLEIPLSGRTLALGPLDLGLLSATILLALLPPRRVPVAAGVPFFAIFVAWATMSVLWSIDPSRSAASALPLLEAVIMYLAAQRSFSSDEAPTLHTALRIFLVVLLVQMFGSVLAAAVQIDISTPYYSYYQFKNSFHTPIGRSNHLALYLEFVLFYELCTARRGSLLFAALATLGLGLTFSRAGLGLTALALIPLLVGVIGNRETRRLAWSLTLAIATASMGLLFTDIGRLLLSGGALISRTAQSRLELWSLAWDVAKVRPLTGIGFGTFEVIGGQREIHNLALELLSTTGLVGFALFLTGGLLFFLSLGRVPSASLRCREAMALAYASGVLVVHSLVEPFFLDRSMIWVAIVLASCTTLLAQEVVKPHHIHQDGPNTLASPPGDSQ